MAENTAEVEKKEEKKEEVAIAATTVAQSVETTQKVKQLEDELNKAKEDRIQNEKLMSQIKASLQSEKDEKAKL